MTKRLKTLKGLKIYRKLIVSLLAISLLAACNQIVYVPNACLVLTEIKVSDEDRIALRESKLSNQFIIDVKNYNDFIRTCPKE